MNKNGVMRKFPKTSCRDSNVTPLKGEYTVSEVFKMFLGRDGPGTGTLQQQCIFSENTFLFQNAGSTLLMRGTCLDHASQPGQHRVVLATLGHQGDQAGMQIPTGYRCKLSIWGDSSAQGLETKDTVKCESRSLKQNSVGDMDSSLKV